MSDIITVKVILYPVDGQSVASVYAIDPQILADARQRLEPPHNFTSYDCHCQKRRVVIAARELAVKRITDGIGDMIHRLFAKDDK